MKNEHGLVEGPLPQWTPSAEWTAATEQLLASESELEQAYGEVYQAGCFVREFGGPEEPNGFAAVGEMSAIAEVEFRSGEEIDIQELGLGDCIALGACPGSGDSRAERVRDGLRQALETRQFKQDPNALTLYGSFTEGGYAVEAFMPSNARQARQWTIKVRKEGQDEVFRELTVPMVYEPIFGVDVEDRATLEARVDQLMRELAA